MQPRTDNQVWTEVQIAKPLNEKIDFVLLGVMRFGRNVSRPVNERIGAGISIKAGKYLTLFPFYLHVDSQPTAINHSSVGVFSDRNRVEFHLHSPPPDFIQYRNRMQLEHPLGFYGLHGFLGDEVFYDSLASAWIRNRIYVGVSKEVNKHFKLELYYGRQNDSHSRPGDLNVVGTSFKFRV